MILAAPFGWFVIVVNAEGWVQHPVIAWNFHEHGTALPEPITLHGRWHGQISPGTGQPIWDDRLLLRAPDNQTQEHGGEKRVWAKPQDAIAQMQRELK
jgi:hypothetical protein